MLSSTLKIMYSVAEGIAIDLALLPPKDKWNLIYMTLILHGVGTLIVFNMFITAKDYFVKYKLVNAPFYADKFLVFIGYACQTPNLVFSWLNVFVPTRGKLATRIVWSLIMEVLLFLVTTILAMVNSSEWPVAFFWITVVVVFFLNVFNAVFRSSVYGVAARLPHKYPGAVVLGSNLSGTIIVFLNWASDNIGASLRTSAIYYFIGGIFVFLICLDTYYALPLNRFYRYYDTLGQATFVDNADLAGPSSSQNKERIPYGDLLKQCWVQLYNIFLTFFVSLTVFPAINSDVKPISPGFLGDNFVRITCFLTFNLTAMIGNITAMLWQFPSRRWLSILTTIRILFIPAFFFCNYHPSGRTRTLPVLVTSDWLYWALAMLLGWSSGHSSSLGMMYISGNVVQEYKSKAGMLGAATIVTGILSGLLFSGICPSIVSA